MEAEGNDIFIIKGLRVNEKMISKIKKPGKMNNTTFRVCEKLGKNVNYALSLVTN